ncbi:MAG: hypothetical protein JO303_02825 [Caulobacteraceae bacterium]|nr:hypothetical protein [Caulobacteraceae bacterium]
MGPAGLAILLAGLAASGAVALLTHGRVILLVLPLLFAAPLSLWRRR